MLPETHLIVGVHAAQQILARSATDPCMVLSQDDGCVVAAVCFACGGVPFEGHHLSSRQCSRQASLTLLDHGFGLPAVRHVNIGAIDALCATFGVIRYQGARLDPSDVTIQKNNAILAVLLAASFFNTSLTVCVEAR